MDYQIIEIPEGYVAKIEGGKVHIVPQESEDERIRQEIIKTISWIVPDCQYAIVLPREQKNEWLAWLEKQKEQKPFNVCEQCPYYKDCPDYNEQKPVDLQVKGDGVYKICPHCKERMIRDDSKVYTSMPPQYGYNCPKCGAFEFDMVMYDSPAKEEQKPVEGISGKTEEIPSNWSEDFEENIRILLHDKLTWHSEDGSMSSTVFIDDKTLKDIINGIWFYVWKEALKYPNKELRVSEWSEEDETRLTNILIMLKEVAAHHYSKDDIDKSVTWLEHLRPQPREEVYLVAKHDMAIKFMNFLDENRPEGMMSLSNGECEDIDKAFKENDWAKIIRYITKYQSQEKWSEDDEKMLNETKKRLRILQAHLSHSHSESMPDKEYSSQMLQIEMCVSWLDIRFESLRPQPHWKPTDEQMEALQRAIDACECEWAYEDTELRSLLSDLKKLMEEQQ